MSKSPVSECQKIVIGVQDTAREAFKLGVLLAIKVYFFKK